MEGSSHKKQLRADMRERRNSLDTSQRHRFNHAICAALETFVTQSGITSLSAFIAFDGEPDIVATLAGFSRKGIRVYLPVITPLEGGKELQFHRWHDNEDLQRNSFGILEPSDPEIVGIEELDLVLMPLVAWDECGRRLGMGAGYYDRALSGVADCKRPVRAGVAYQVQKADVLPEDPWDVRLHMMFSELGRFTCTG